MNSLYIKEEPKLQDILDFLDKCHVKKKEPIKLYIDCGGGNTADFFLITDRLNWMVDLDYDITIHILYAGSAAFRLCWEFKGKRVLEREADGMVHMSYMEIPSYHGTIIYADGTCRGRKEFYEQEEMYQYNFFTDREREFYTSGRDLYISPPRMQEIFSQEEPVLQQ